MSRGGYYDVGVLSSSMQFVAQEEQGRCARMPFCDSALYRGGAIARAALAIAAWVSSVAIVGRCLQQRFSLSFAKGNASFAGAAAVVGLRSFGGLCALSPIFLEMQQFPAGERAELPPECIGLFADKGEDFLFIFRDAGEIAPAVSCNERKTGERAAKAAHATHACSEARRQLQSGGFAQAHVGGAGGKDGLGAIKALVEIIGSRGHALSIQGGENVVNLLSH